MTEKRFGKLLNPFVFPSETHLRSILLTWAILGLCWLVGFYFVKVLAGNLGWPAVRALPFPDREVLHIDDTASTSPTPDNSRAWLVRMGPKYQELKSPGGLGRTQAALADLSKAAHFRLKVINPYFAIPALFLAFANLCILSLYFVRARCLWLSGRVLLRTDNESLLQNAFGAVTREAQEMLRQQGERPIPQPRLLVSRGALGDGLVFGTSRRPFILLTRAMLLFLRKEVRQRGESHSFRTVVLHELAHLANRDVNRSRWAEASWGISLPVLTLLIVMLWMLNPSLDSQVWFQVGGRVMAILLVVEWIRRGILRGREHEADLRTALPWNASAPLHSLLAEDKRDPHPPSGLLKRFASLWRRHPTKVERREALDHPNRVFVLKIDVSFFAGLLCGNLIGSILPLTGLIVLATNALGDLMISSVLEEFIRSRGPAMALQFYPLGGILMLVSALSLFCAVSYLVARTLGAQAQRESVLQVVEANRNSHPYRALLKPAFFTAAGFEVGLILLPMTPFSPGKMWEFVSMIVWVSFATLVFWGWLSVIRLFARRLLGTHFALRKPERQLRIVTWASTILLWPLILILLDGQFWIRPSIQPVGGTGVLAIGAITLLGFLFPLALMLLALAIREVRREERRPLCPHCRSEVSSSTSAAADCAACGNPLAAWLFIQVPATLEAGVA